MPDAFAGKRTKMGEARLYMPNAIAVKRTKLREARLYDRRQLREGWIFWLRLGCAVFAFVAKL